MFWIIKCSVNNENIEEDLTLKEEKNNYFPLIGIALFGLVTGLVTGRYYCPKTEETKSNSENKKNKNDEIVNKQTPITADITLWMTDKLSDDVSPQKLIAAFEAIEGNKENKEQAYKICQNTVFKFFNEIEDGNQCIAVLEIIAGKNSKFKFYYENLLKFKEEVLKNLKIAPFFIEEVKKAFEEEYEPKELKEMIADFKNYIEYEQPEVLEDIVADKTFMDEVKLQLNMIINQYQNLFYIKKLNYLILENKNLLKNLTAEKTKYEKWAADKNTLIKKLETELTPIKNNLEAEMKNQKDLQDKINKAEENLKSIKEDAQDKIEEAKKILSDLKSQESENLKKERFDLEKKNDQIKMQEKLWKEHQAKIKEIEKQLKNLNDADTEEKLKKAQSELKKDFDKILNQFKITINEKKLAVEKQISDADSVISNNQIPKEANSEEEKLAKKTAEKKLADATKKKKEANQFISTIVKIEILENKYFSLSKLESLCNKSLEEYKQNIKIIDDLKKNMNLI